MKCLAWPDLGLNCRAAVKFDGQVLINRHCDVPRADGHFPGSPCGEQGEHCFGTALQSRDNPIVARDLRQRRSRGFPSSAKVVVEGDQAIKVWADQLIGFDPGGRQQKTGYALVAAEIQMARHCPIPNLTRAAAEKTRIAMDSIVEI
jgi:hypothetical protein